MARQFSSLRLRRRGSRSSLKRWGPPIGGGLGLANPNPPSLIQSPNAVADIIAVNSKRKVNQLNVQLLPHYFAQNLQQNLSNHNFSFTLAKLTIFKVTIFEIVNRISKKPSGPIDYVDGGRYT